MSSISQVSSVATSIIGRIGPRGVESRSGASTSAGATVSTISDQVEISATALNAARSNSQVETSTFEQARQARINAVRQQIQDGTYDLEGKSAVVADRLARALRSI